MTVCKTVCFFLLFFCLFLFCFSIFGFFTKTLAFTLFRDVCVFICAVKFLHLSCYIKTLKNCVQPELMDTPLQLQSCSNRLFEQQAKLDLTATCHWDKLEFKPKWKSSNRNGSSGCPSVQLKCFFFLFLSFLLQLFYILIMCGLKKILNFCLSHT